MKLCQHLLQTNLPFCTSTIAIPCGQVLLACKRRAISCKKLYSKKQQVKVKTNKSSCGKNISIICMAPQIWTSLRDTCDSLSNRQVFAHPLPQFVCLYRITNLATTDSKLPRKKRAITHRAKTLMRSTNKGLQKHKIERHASSSIFSNTWPILSTSSWGTWCPSVSKRA